MQESVDFTGGVPLMPLFDSWVLTSEAFSSSWTEGDYLVFRRVVYCKASSYGIELANDSAAATS